MNSTFKFVDVDSAIIELKKIKKENKNAKIVMYTINFDNEKESKTTITPDEGCNFVKQAKTIIINNDEFIPHMELYSTVQNDIKNIIREGIMHDIFLRR